MILIAICIITFFVSHLFPETSIRTNMFFSGHFVSAFKSDLSFEKKLDENTAIYRVGDAPTDSLTRMSLDRYEVECQLKILYFAKYHGA